MTSVPFQQNTAGSCGLYVLANLFNEPSFLAGARPGLGHNTFMLNQLVVPYLGNEVYLCDDYLLPLGLGRIGRHQQLFNFEGAEDPAEESVPNTCLAYLLVIANAAETMLHLVGAVHEAKRGGRLWVVDSLQPQVQETTLRDFFARHHVTAITNFRLMQEGSGLVALWHLDRFAHLTGLPLTNTHD